MKKGSVEGFNNFVKKIKPDAELSPGNLHCTLDEREYGLPINFKGRLIPYSAWIQAHLRAGITPGQAAAALLQYNIDTGKTTQSRSKFACMMLYIMHLGNSTVPEHNDPTSVQTPDPVDSGTAG